MLPDESSQLQFQTRGSDKQRFDEMGNREVLD